MFQKFKEMSETINENPLILQSIDIDLNKLLSFSYTFDNLKAFMSSISKNQFLMSDKINELENKLKSQKDINRKYHNSLINFDKKLNFLETNIIKLGKKLKTESSKLFNEKEKIIELKKEKIKIDEQNKNKIKLEKEIKEITEIKEIKEIKEEKEEKEEEKGLKYEKEEKEIKDDKENDDKKNEIKKERKISENIIQKEKLYRKESSISLDIEGEYSHVNLNEFIFNENQDMLEIRNRLACIESKLKEYDLSLPQKNIHLVDDNSKKEEIDLIKNQVKKIMERTDEMRFQNDDLEKRVEEISVKVLDFNIIDILNKGSPNGSKIDSNKLIALNLEQKFKKKTSILDEKAKKTEDEINKIKNNFDNIKINFDVIEENFNLTKANIKDLKEEIMKSNIDFRNLISDINNRINENFQQRIEAQKRGVNKNLDQLRQEIKNINDKGTLLDEDINKIGIGLSESDLKYISEISKKIGELEKQIPLIFRNIETIKEKDNNELTKIENELIQKINQKDFFELNDKVNLQNTISNNIREMVERVQELTNKNMKDLNFFLRKIESLSGSVISMQNTIEHLTGMKHENSIDFANFIDQESFNEFTKLYNKDKKYFERNFDEYRRIISDISEIMKSRASEEDLKNFETIMNNKIEELKINCGKKFADKIDTSKNLKYLDSEIKYISELCIKREKNDNWLIAKKPVGGFSCASCESYIGDLKEKGDYVIWNKYPQREKNVEKNYRIGNGFSRMLSMLNIDIKNSVNNVDLNSYESDDENINQNQHIHHQTNNTINFNISQGMKSSSSNKNRINLKKSLNQIISKKNLPKINSFENILNNDNSLENFSGIKTHEQGSSCQIHNGPKNNENKDKKPHIVKVFKKK